MIYVDTRDADRVRALQYALAAELRYVEWARSSGPTNLCGALLDPRNMQNGATTALLEAARERGDVCAVVVANEQHAHHVRLREPSVRVLSMSARWPMGQRLAPLVDNYAITSAIMECVAEGSAVAANLRYTREALESAGVQITRLREDATRRENQIRAMARELEQLRGGVPTVGPDHDVGASVPEGER